MQKFGSAWILAPNLFYAATKPKGMAVETAIISKYRILIFLSNYQIWNTQINGFAYDRHIKKPVPEPRN